MVATRSSRKNAITDRAAQEAIARGGNYQLRKLLGVKPRQAKRRAAGGKKAATGNNGGKLGACEAKVARLERLVAQIKGGRAVAARRRQRKGANNFRTADLFDTGDLQDTRYVETKWRNEIARTNANTREAAKRRAARRDVRATEPRKPSYAPRAPTGAPPRPRTPPLASRPPWRP